MTAPLQAAQLMCTSTCYPVISVRFFGSFFHPEWLLAFVATDGLSGETPSPAESLPHQTAIALEASLLAKRPVLSPVIRATARHLFNDGFA